MCSIEIDECSVYPCFIRLIYRVSAAIGSRCTSLHRRIVAPTFLFGSDEIHRTIPCRILARERWPIWREVFTEIDLPTVSKYIIARRLLAICWCSIVTFPWVWVQCNRLWCLLNGKSNLLRAFSLRELSAHQTMACCFERGNLFQQYLSLISEGESDDVERRRKLYLIKKKGTGRSTRLIGIDLLNAI